MSDNNTAIPKEIMDKIKIKKDEYDDNYFRDTFQEGAIWMYQLRQQEVDELRLDIDAYKRGFDELQSALTHEKEMRSKEKDEYNKRIAELETRIKKLEYIQETYWR